MCLRRALRFFLCFLILLNHVQKSDRSDQSILSTQKPDASLVNLIKKNTLVSLVHLLLDIVDINNDKILSRNEIRNWLLKLGDASVKRLLREEFLLLDQDKDGIATIEEYFIYREAKYPLIEANPQVSLHCFNRADQNHDNKLDVKEAIPLLLQQQRFEEEIISTSHSALQDAKISARTDTLFLNKVLFIRLSQQLRKIDEEFLKWALDYDFVLQLVDKDENGLLDIQEFSQLFFLDLTHRHSTPQMPVSEFVDTLIDDLRYTFTQLMDEDHLTFDYIFSNVRTFAKSAFTHYGEIFVFRDEFAWVLSCFDSSAVPKLDGILKFNEFNFTSPPPSTLRRQPLIINGI